VLKKSVLKISKRMGLFRLSMVLSHRKLRILCYHGFGDAEDVSFRPKLFITEATFKSRLKKLREMGVSVLPLDEALGAMQDRNLLRCTTAITIDDGFPSVLQIAAKQLNQFSMPATLYVTTYYALKQQPIFRLLVQYIFWKSKKNSIVVNDIPGISDGTYSIADEQSRTRLWQPIVEECERSLTEDARQEIARRLATAAEVNIDRMLRERVLHIMDADEIKQIEQLGVQIELHTHRHRFPIDPALAERELVDNRRTLEAWTGRQLKHFCYPSGAWDRSHWPVLASQEVKSATTCDRGLNTWETNAYALHRFLDSESISMIEFESEICGFSEFLRGLRKFIKRVLSMGDSQPLERTARSAYQ
jgi:peptidoglycan/xylan/chitin deacetylase (PgdA/CDA1 family)